MSTRVTSPLERLFHRPDTYKIACASRTYSTSSDPCSARHDPPRAFRLSLPLSQQFCLCTRTSGGHQLLLVDHHFLGGTNRPGTCSHHRASNYYTAAVVVYQLIVRPQSAGDLPRLLCSHRLFSAFSHVSAISVNGPTSRTTHSNFATLQHPRHSSNMLCVQHIELPLHTAAGRHVRLHDHERGGGLVIMNRRPERALKHQTDITGSRPSRIILMQHHHRRRFPPYNQRGLLAHLMST